MPKYAEWVEYQRGGRHERLVKHIRHIKRRILDENDSMYLVEENEGPMWISKQSVRNVTEE